MIFDSVALIREHELQLRCIGISLELFRVFSPWFAVERIY